MKVTGMLLVSLRGIVNCRYVNLTLGVWDGESLYIYKKCPDTDHTEISLRQPHWSPLGFHLNFPMSIPCQFYVGVSPGCRRSRCTQIMWIS